MMKRVLLLVALWPMSSLAGPSAQQPTHPAFPSELHGTWHPAPHDCESSDGVGNDMRFDISGRKRLNYEDIETAIKVVEVPGPLRTWQLTTTSNVVGDDSGQTRVYVLGPSYLFITDGHRMDQYLQCR